MRHPVSAWLLRTFFVIELALSPQSLFTLHTGDIKNHIKRKRKNFQAFLFFNTAFDLPWG